MIFFIKTLHKGFKIASKGSKNALFYDLREYQDSKQYQVIFITEMKVKTKIDEKSKWGGGNVRSSFSSLKLVPDFTHYWS